MSLHAGRDGPVIMMAAGVRECAALHFGTAPAQYGVMQWDDLRYVLAVARTGSALRAAQSLGVNQTTVLRRLDLLEAAVGEPIFERRTSGLSLTEAGRVVTDAAERMEQEAQALRNKLNARQRTIAGSVRLTASEVVDVCLVTPCLMSFHAMYPDVAVELIVSNAALDIAGGEADVGLRAGLRPQGAGVVARRLPDLDWAIYCSRAYAAERGIPDRQDAIAGHHIVGMEGRLAQLRSWQWLANSAPGTAIRLRCNSLLNLVSNVKAGLGLGAMPVIVGDAEPELVRCITLPPELRAELWLILREDVKSQPHIRALADFLAKFVRDKLAETAPR